MEIYEVPCAYLNTDMPKYKFLLLKLENNFVEIMCKVDPEFRK